MRPVYENFTVPNGGGVTATTEKVPEPAVRKSGGGRLKKSQIDEDFSEVDEDDVYNSEDLPPPSKSNKLLTSTFFREFPELLSRYADSYCDVSFWGDFNLHYDNDLDSQVTRMKTLLSDHGLCQLVDQATHRQGHILDWVVMRADSSRLSLQSVLDAAGLSDHHVLVCNLAVARPPPPTRIVTSRRLRAVRLADLQSDVAALAVSLEDRCAAPGVDVEVLVDSYNYGLREILDRHAPSVTRRVRDRASAPWLSAEVMEARRRRRRAERLWRKTHLTVHRQIFTQQRAAAKSCLLAAKTQFYHDRIESAVSSKQLFAVSSELLGKSKTKVLPTDVPGPRVNTIDDLWWMVWQEGITQIVMLANLQEDGKDKCEEYWPAAGKSQTYGHVTVRGLKEQQRADYAIRSFVLKAAGRERHVTQYHYMAWPDHGVPLAASLVDYWRYVKARTTSTVPLLVHCSAGVGRTGTFIALDIASEKESRGEDVNVNEIVTKLREQRALMVQSEAQYKFLHEVVLEAHTSRATRVTVSQFDFIFPDNIEVKKDNSRIDKEFQMLKQMGQFAKPSSSMATMPENLDKNRNMDALPDDEHVVYLSAYVRGRTQYINAVYLPSFYHRHGFVLTQLPIPNNTLIDFWRLVDGCHVTKIVSLGSDHEQETVKNFCQYWPLTSGEVLTTGPYSVTMDASNRLGTFLHSYRLILKSENNDSSREVEVLQYKDWAGQVPSDTSSLLHLVDTVKAKQSDDVTAPIIVQCIDGAAKSGLFAVLCDVISRVTHDDEVDVYLTAREVQRIRPQAVATQTQYRYLYKAAQEYIRHVGVYANSGVR
nr:hypothetical protein BaRGS_004279 [Batillaria attramentaria]